MDEIRIDKFNSDGKVLSSEEKLSVFYVGLISMKRELLELTAVFKVGSSYLFTAMNIYGLDRRYV